ncbi:hypothetical protein CVT26_005688 [Gymnopilus dilepis]|uniref:Uncharacterized protein n=1 Tax=Gymnopilus dilepis TaxID=231916 RepID=A0A409W8E4_9AGAR|nr:hypothetical protein CVT26_005688 [Gymnopilus dilepis]
MSTLIPSGSHGLRRSNARHKRNVSWDRSVDIAEDRRSMDRQRALQSTAPASTPMYAYDTEQGGEAVPVYIYAWPNDARQAVEEYAAGNGSEAYGYGHRDEPLMQGSLPRRRLISQPAYPANPVWPSQSSSFPETYAQSSAPHLQPISSSPKRSIITTPSRTAGGYTPHPMAQSSFHQQMNESDNALVLSNRYSNNASNSERFYSPSSPNYDLHGGLSTHMPRQSQTMANRLTEADDVPLDTVYVQVWSYLRRQLVPRKGIILQVLRHCDAYGSENLCYQVGVKNPDTKEAQSCVVPLDSVQVWSAPPEERSHYSSLFRSSPEISRPPHAISRHPRSPSTGGTLKPGDYVFTRVMVSFGRKDQPRLVWYPSVCIVPNESNGYLFHGLGGALKSTYYSSAGPFKPFGTKTMEELLKHGEQVDAKGCKYL